ncbi:MAG: hypothetical protein RSD67_02435 [Oscillospiraceae bacterium]
MDETKDVENILPEKAVWDVLKFAQSYYGKSGQYSNFYTPQLLQDNMVSLNNNPQLPSIDKINTALSNAVQSADQLRGYSEWLEYWDKMYSKVLNYYANILSFDLSYSCINAYSIQDYKSKEYKEDLRRMHKVLDNFQYRDEFRKIVKEMLRRETVFTWFRDSSGTIDDTALDLEDNVKKKSTYALQMMPQKYGILTGYFATGLLWALDMTYFLQPSSDILLFDPSIKQSWQDVFDFKNHTIKPSAPLDKISGTFALQAMVSPENGAWAFKTDTSNFNNVPPLSGLLRPAMLNSEIQELQRSKDIASAYALIVGELKMFENAKSGTEQNQFSVSPEVLGQFLQLVQNGLKKNIRPVAMPTENTKFMQYEDKNPDMYKNQVQQTASQGVSASRIIYSADKMSQEEIRLAVSNDCNFMEKLYAQFNNFMNFYVNKKTKKYKFDFEFEGVNFDFKRDNNFDRLIKASDKGLCVNTSKWAASLGIKPTTFDRMLEEVQGTDLVSKLTLLLNANTTAQGQSAGRPIQKEVSTEAREYDS